MKFFIAALLFVCLFCINPVSRAAFAIKLKTETVSPSGSLVVNTATRSSGIEGANVFSSLPRGRGNGKDGLMTFMLGFFAIFPFIGLIPAFFAYKKGVKNVGRIRKYRGFAIAGMVLATLGIVLTILILTA